MLLISEIESKIQILNSTLFQEMCDEIILRKYPKHKAFERSGMATGKQETRSGTPDSFILLNNNEYIFNEHTKNEGLGIKKLLSDFESCIDKSKTGISKDEIRTINFCISFKLLPLNTKILNKACNENGITMELWSLDRLARNLFNQNPDLCNKYLGMPLDKSQWVSLKTFTDNYNRAGKSISTPLDNPFFHRDAEIKTTLESLWEKHLTVLSGPAGAGKSKLAVEILRRLETDNPNTVVWVNTFDSVSILDDLLSKLTTAKNTFLFIDDAHRISDFQQILNFLKNSIYENVKLIVTVRDYARSDFEQHFYEYDFSSIHVNRLNNEEITEILKSKPFHISHVEHQQKIVNLAQGNVRLALMLARLKGVNKEMSALNNTAEAFDFYFKTYLKDSDSLKNHGVIKVMAIVTFFNSLDMNSENFDVHVLKTFKINKDEFTKNIGLLDKLELISIYQDEIKVVEQNLGFYFFNKAFFELNLLQFDVLLTNFFPRLLSRFKDCVISSNNNFGHENVIKQIKPSLVKYGNSKDIDRRDQIKFHDLFWFAIPEKTLEYLFEISVRGKALEVERYVFKYEQNDFAYDKNPVFTLISHFLRKPTQYIENVVKTGLEYVRRNPDTSPEFLFTLREYLGFNYEDINFGYYKQRTVLNILLEGFKDNKQLEKELFYHIGRTFLKHNFQQFEPTYDNSISFYNFPLQMNTLIEEFRKDIWLAVTENIENYPEYSLNLLSSCSSQHPDNNIELMRFDLEYILEIIDKKLDPKLFKHCCYVNQQIWWCRRCKVDDSAFDEILLKFNCKQFELFSVLNSKWLNGKRRWEYHNEISLEDYDNLKYQEISKFVLDNYSKDIDCLYKDYEHILMATNYEWSIKDSSFDIAVTEIFKSNENQGLKLLTLIVENENKIEFVPHRSFKNILCTEDLAINVHKIIQTSNYKKKTNFLLSYFFYLNVTSLELKITGDILVWAGNIKDGFSLSFKWFEKYLAHNPRLFHQVLPHINSKVKSGTWIHIHTSLFEDFIYLFRDDLHILEETYLIQDFAEEHFDYDSKALAKICQEDNDFLVRYFKYYYQRPELKRSRRELRDRYNFIWQSKELIAKVEGVLDYIISKESYYGISDHAACNLFNNLQTNDKKRGIRFLKSYMLKKTEQPAHLNVIMDIVHKKFPEERGNFIKIHLLNNRNKKIFEQVRWIISQGVWSGNVNPELIRAKRWEEVLGFIESLKDDITLIPIKSFVKEEIERQREYADFENRRRKR